jgi:hypothetical protein
VNGFRGNGRAGQSRYATAIRAVIESAVVTWIGIVLCEIGLLAPTGHITVRADYFFGSWVATEGGHLDGPKYGNRYTQYHTRFLRKLSLQHPTIKVLFFHTLLGYLTVPDHGSFGTCKGNTSWNAGVY